MSTPTRIPTPADLARRPPRPTPRPTSKASVRPAARAPYKPRPLTAEEAIAPGKLKKEEHFRKFYLIGVRHSGMPAHARLVGHDLMWRASHATGRLSPNRQPSTEILAAATGLLPAQVDVALEILHSRGWLKRRVLKCGPRTGQTVYDLTIPSAVVEQIRAMPRAQVSHSYAR